MNVSSTEGNLKVHSLDRDITPVVALQVRVVVSTRMRSSLLAFESFGV